MCTFLSCIFPQLVSIYDMMSVWMRSHISGLLTSYAQLDKLGSRTHAYMVLDLENIFYIRESLVQVLQYMYIVHVIWYVTN